MKKTFLSILFVLILVFTCGYACKGENVEKYSVRITNDKLCGKITGVNSAAFYEKDTVLTITVTANEGYKISYVLWNGEQVEVINGHEVYFERTVSEDCTLEVGYAEGYYQTVIENDNLDGVVNGVQNNVYYKYAQTLSITITPSEGKKITEVLWNNQKINITNEKGFSFQVTINGTSSLKVSYVSTLKSVTVNNDDNKGFVTGVANGAKYEIDSWKTISVTPYSDYLIESITWNGNVEPLTSAQKKNGWQTQKQITGDSILTVTYKTTKSVLTIENDHQKGMISGATNGQKFEIGAMATITVSPLPGYKIASVSWNGTQKTLTEEQKNTGYAFTENMNSDSVLNISYQENKKTASVVNNAEQGTVTGIVNGEEYGFRQMITISVTPKEGYVIKSIKWNGADILLTDLQKVSGTQIQKQIGENNSLVVEYQAKPVEKYTATVSFSSALVSVSGVNESADYYGVGDVITLAVTAKEGYKISSITINGNSAVVTNEQTFSYEIVVIGDTNIVILAEGWSENI